MKIAKSGGLFVVVAVLMLIPAAALGAGVFNDVPAGHTFEADIEWLASVDVTRGCNPPANDLYCPDDAVTRGQMAAFLHRLADNVVDAATVDGLNAADVVSVYGVTLGEWDDFFFAGMGSILSDTIDAPVDGFFHITASVSAGDDNTMAGTGALVVAVDVDDVTVTTEALVWFSECTFPSISCGDDTVTLTAVVPVTAGSHDIDLMAIENGFGSHLHGRSISTIFTPFGSTGAG
ncbi:MAG: hypothetical protein U9N84_11110 [Actinomycetota bacterium]|nr:hypothetical protein [Actinomycetota bacterium]